MTPENNCADTLPTRFAFAPLKPKRRCKLDDKIQDEIPENSDPPDEQTRMHEPVLINARTAFRHRRDRMTRSGRPHLTFQRITSPTEFSELVPMKSRPPVLARVVDKVKSKPLGSRNGQGIWALLRWWVLAFR
jgi:hypothetical protein